MAKIKDILTNISNVSVGTWVRLILLVISLINSGLTAFGITPVPADYDTIYTIASIVLAIVVGFNAYWKNNSFTKAAQAADEYLHNNGFAVEDPGEDLEVAE